MKFIKNDIVEIIDCPELREWGGFRDELIGIQYKINERDAARLNNGHAVLLFNNAYHINFIAEYFKILNRDWDI